MMYDCIWEESSSEARQVSLSLHTHARLGDVLFSIFRDLDFPVYDKQLNQEKCPRTVWSLFFSMVMTEVKAVHLQNGCWFQILSTTYAGMLEIEKRGPSTSISPWAFMGRADTLIIGTWRSLQLKASIPVTKWSCSYFPYRQYKYKWHDFHIYSKWKAKQASVCWKRASMTKARQK